MSLLTDFFEAGLPLPPDVAKASPEKVAAELEQWERDNVNAAHDMITARAKHFAKDGDYRIAAHFNSRAAEYARSNERKITSLCDAILNHGSIGDGHQVRSCFLSIGNLCADPTVGWMARAVALQRLGGQLLNYRDLAGALLHLQEADGLLRRILNRKDLDPEQSKAALERRVSGLRRMGRIFTAMDSREQADRLFGEALFFSETLERGEALSDTVVDQIQAAAATDVKQAISLTIEKGDITEGAKTLGRVRAAIIKGNCLLANGNRKEGMELLTMAGKEAQALQIVLPRYPTLDNPEMFQAARVGITLQLYDECLFEGPRELDRIAKAILPVDEKASSISLAYAASRAVQETDEEKRRPKKARPIAELNPEDLVRARKELLGQVLADIGRPWVDAYDGARMKRREILTSRTLIALAMRTQLIVCECAHGWCLLPGSKSLDRLEEVPEDVRGVAHCYFRYYGSSFTIDDLWNAGQSVRSKNKRSIARRLTSFKKWLEMASLLPADITVFHRGNNYTWSIPKSLTFCWITADEDYDKSVLRLSDEKIRPALQ